MAFSVKHRKKQGANLLKLYTDQKLCDITFLVSDGKEQEEISTHRLTFAGLSDECEKMVSNKQQNIKIDANPSAFKYVLKFSYCNDPQLKEDDIAAVKSICDRYNISSLSTFCEDYLKYLAENKIKTIRKKLVSVFKKDANAKKRWEKTFENLDYGCYKKSKIGARAYHHTLDSDGIRKQMADIIPKNCDLKFAFGKVNATQYRLIGEFNLSQQFENSSQMKDAIDNHLYNSKISFEIDSKKYLFWCKSLKKSALDRAMGSEVSDYIMRYRQMIVIHLDDKFLIELSGNNVGIGFCNLYKTDKNIEGHKMIHIEEGCMDSVKIRCFVKNDVNKFQIEMQLISKEKLKEKSPLLLFFFNEPLQNDADFEDESYNTNNSNQAHRPFQVTDPRQYGIQNDMHNDLINRRRDFRENRRQQIRNNLTNDVNSVMTRPYQMNFKDLTDGSTSTSGSGSYNNFNGRM